MTIRDIGLESEGLLLVLAANGDKPAVGYGDNLIVEVYVEYTQGGRKGDKAKGRQQTRRANLGVLPGHPVRDRGEVGRSPVESSPLSPE